MVAIFYLTEAQISASNICGVFLKRYLQFSRRLFRQFSKGSSPTARSIILVITSECLSINNQRKPGSIRFLTLSTLVAPTVFAKTFVEFRFKAQLFRNIDLKFLSVNHADQHKLSRLVGTSLKVVLPEVTYLALYFQEHHSILCNGDFSLVFAEYLRPPIYSRWGLKKSEVDRSLIILVPRFNLLWSLTYLTSILSNMK